MTVLVTQTPEPLTVMSSRRWGWARGESQFLLDHLLGRGESRAIGHHSDNPGYRVRFYFAGVVAQHFLINNLRGVREPFWNWLGRGESSGVLRFQFVSHHDFTASLINWHNSHCSTVREHLSK